MAVAAVVSNKLQSHSVFFVLARGPLGETIFEGSLVVIMIQSLQASVLQWMHHILLLLPVCDGHSAVVSNKP